MSKEELDRVPIMEQIRDTVGQRDHGRLKSMLYGEGLPAMSRTTTPVEDIIDAVLSSQSNNELRFSMSALVASLVSELDLESEHSIDAVYVHDLLQLVSCLPRNEATFAALTGLFKQQQDNRTSPIIERSLLWKALAEQQTDSRLRDYWLQNLTNPELIETERGRTELNESWRGLIRSTPKSGENGPDYTAINDGLVSLALVTAGNEMSESCIKLAFVELNYAFPRDDNDWAKHFAGIYDDSHIIGQAAIAVWGRSSQTTLEPTTPVLSPDSTVRLFQILHGDRIVVHPLYAITAIMLAIHNKNFAPGNEFATGRF